MGRVSPDAARSASLGNLSTDKVVNVDILPIPYQVGGLLKYRILIPALLSVSALAAVGCGGASDSTDDASAAPSSSGRTQLALVASSTPEVVYDQVIPDFQKTADGKDVGFKTSYGASGEQSRAVDAGLKADVVSVSTEPDMQRLVDSGLVDSGWKSATPSHGLVTTSLVSFIVRRGNPKHIKTWD